MSSDSKNLSENIENNEKIENSNDIYRVFYDVNGTLEHNPVIYRRKEIPSLVVNLVIHKIIYPRICERHGYTQADVKQTDISVYNVSAEDFKAKRDSAVTLPTNGLVEDEDEIAAEAHHVAGSVLLDLGEGPHLCSFIHMADLHKFQQVDLHHNKIICLVQDSLPSFVRTFLETLGSKRFFPEDEHARLSKELEKTRHQTTKLFAASDVSLKNSAVSHKNNAIPLESLENSIISLEDNAALQASACEVDHYISLHKFLVALDRISTLIQTNGLQEVTSRVFFVDLGINLLLSMKSFHRDRRVAIYPSTKPWPIKQLVLTVVDQTPPTYFSYKPKSDFGIWEVLPPLLTETQSQADKEDFYRLLLQGGSIVRLVSVVQKEDKKPRQFILPLVYVDQLWQDVRFLLMFQQDSEVCYFEKVFDLTLMDDSLCVLLHLYNLLDYIRSVNDEALQNHVSNAFARLSSIQTSGSKTQFKRKTEDNNQSPRKRNCDEESWQIGGLARQHRYRLEIEHEGSGVHFGTSPDGIKVAVKRGCSVELVIYDYLRKLKDSITRPMGKVLRNTGEHDK
ncbi:hypothetical protein BDP27DRAFT_1422072 [Rhodocollybia butyracea]|uniref:Uncharacterized protein n=1 Tax=Rhodocollybia butyracea TaxID=206335 RepID=A0A9P5PSG4_9AGAR|nr:hypothetical protein BDP27DRAFT_1422072 [Rhodocollybia butyracea]